jgi:hypothetical protein
MRVYQTTHDEEGFAIRDADSTTYTGAIKTAEEFRSAFMPAFLRNSSAGGSKKSRSFVQRMSASPMAVSHL